MYSDQLPFARGKVFGITSSTDGAGLLGQEFIVEDKDPSDPTKKRSNRLVHLKVVRNSSGITLLPKRLARYKAATVNTEVDGYPAAVATWFAGVIDEFLPSAGVATNEVFYIVTKGPSNCLTDIGAPDDIVADDVLVSIAGATSQSTTAGRVDLQVLTGATAVLAVQVQNRVGRAMSAVTSGNTNSSILVDVRADY
jgi:hypothetical protein